MIQIDTDNEGFPVEAHTLKDILVRLGFKTEGGKFVTDKDNPYLSAYPRISDMEDVSDDGKFICFLKKDIHQKDVDTIEYEVGANPKLDITIKTQVETIDTFDIFTYNEQ